LEEVSETILLLLPSHRHLHCRPPLRHRTSAAAAWSLIYLFWKTRLLISGLCEAAANPLPVFRKRLTGSVL
jgi:hypothetical protein